MQIFNSLTAWIEFRKTLSPQISIGFVPTMGNLHSGHLSLISASIQQNDLCVCSLFINPTQFNNPEDFKKYPKTLEQDLKLLEKAGIHYCLVPKEEEIYADHYQYQIQETEFSNILEGKYRPGHFNGVLTVVLKLLNLVQPTNAYFGEKDYQQYLLVKNMVKAFFIPSNILVYPTIREPSGLAYSSRNNRLNLQEKVLAEKFAQLFLTISSLEELKKRLSDLKILVEYLIDYENRRYISVFIGSVRLIDNKALT
jgi:pantoate--beta-alanine ligase